jgi:hypothetical protein
MIVREAFRGDREQRETINFNLFRLSEQLTFAFRLEENRIIPQYRFSRTPFRYVKIDEIRYAGRIFDTDVMLKTDITARPLEGHQSDMCHSVPEIQ